MDSILEVSNYLHALAQKGDASAIAQILNVASDVRIVVSPSAFDAYSSDGAEPMCACVEANGFQIGVGSFLGFHLQSVPQQNAYEAQVIRRARLHAERNAIERRADDIVPDAFGILAAEQLKKQQQQAARDAVIASIRDNAAPMQPKEKELITAGIAALMDGKPSQGRGEELVVRELPQDRLNAVVAALRYFGVPHAAPEYNSYAGTAFIQLRAGPYASAPDGTVEGVLARIEREKQALKPVVSAKKMPLSRLFRALLNGFSGKGPA